MQFNGLCPPERTNGFFFEKSVRKKTINANGNQHTYSGANKYIQRKMLRKINPGETSQYGNGKK